MQQADHPRTVEIDKLRIFQRQNRLGAAGITLARAAAVELAVDAVRIVEAQRNDVQTTEVLDAVAKFDIGTPAGHVGRYSNGAPAPSGGLERYRQRGEEISHDLSELGQCGFSLDAYKGIDFRPMGEIGLKGFPDPVALYEVAWTSTDDA